MEIIVGKRITRGLLFFATPTAAAASLASIHQLELGTK